MSHTGGCNQLIQILQLADIALNADTITLQCVQCIIQPSLVATKQNQLRTLLGIHLCCRQPDTAAATGSAFGHLPDRFISETLLEDQYVCVVRQNHPLTQGRLTLKRYAAARHMLISPKGDERGFVDDILARRNLSRHIALIINQFAPTGRLIEQSDMVVTVTQRLAQIFCLSHDVCVLPLPVAAPLNYSQTKIVWHKHYGSEPGVIWLRKQILKTAKNLTG